MAHTVTDQDVTRFVTGALTHENYEDFDIDAIVHDLIFGYDITGFKDLSDVKEIDRAVAWIADQIDEAEFWAIVAKHDRTA
jgi:hypothetical protein